MSAFLSVAGIDQLPSAYVARHGRVEREFSHPAQDFGTPIDIGFLQQEMPDDPDGIDLTVAFQARMGTAFLPYNVTGTTASEG